MTGLDAQRVAAVAAGEGVVLSELTTLERSLEDAYFALTAASAEYRSSPAPAGRALTPSATTTSEEEIKEEQKQE